MVKKDEEKVYNQAEYKRQEKIIETQWDKIIGGNYKRPEKTQEKINEIKRETNTKKALEGIVDLLENYTNYEEKVPVEYDPKTGEPIKFEWKKDNKSACFNQKIIYGGYDLSPPDVKLADVVAKEVIERGPFIIKSQENAYVFFEGINESSPGKAIHVRKAKEL